MSASKGSWRSADPDSGPVLELDAYLESLGLSHHSAVPGHACEICDGTRSVVMRDRVLASSGAWVRWRVEACERCGLLMQRPRFAPAFYRAYYASLYRLVTSGAREPSAGYIADQASRGRHLAASLSRYLPRRGHLLDVGCAAGGMMKPFLEAGWSAEGVDPDEGAVAHGSATLGLPVRLGDAETVEAAQGSADLILITGSLEHAYDPNLALKRCHVAAAPDAHLLVEGWGLAQARQLGGFGHNQRRFFTLPAISLLMLKHGWQPILATRRPLSGPTRPGSVFVLGRRADPMGVAGLLDTIQKGLRDDPRQLRRRLARLGIA